MTEQSIEQQAREDYWRCFHCDFATTDRAEAEAHFGDRDDAEEFKPICKWWGQMNDEDKAHALQSALQDLNYERMENYSLDKQIGPLEQERDQLRAEVERYNASPAPDLHEQAVPKDILGNDVKVGDYVLIQCTVMNIADNPNGQNNLIVSPLDTALIYQLVVSSKDVAVKVMAVIKDECLRQAIDALNNTINIRLNNHLLEMKPNYDDSIVGFNEAQDIVQATFKEFQAILG